MSKCLVKNTDYIFAELFPQAGGQNPDADGTKGGITDIDRPWALEAQEMPLNQSWG